MPINQDLVRKIKSREMSSAPDMRNAGNLVLEVRELRKLVKKTR